LTTVLAAPLIALALLAPPPPCRLRGGAGDDRLEGGGGRDVLDCGPGHDFAVAGPGDRTRGCETVAR
jgi:hemolysin type calcium-binding protein